MEDELEAVNREAAILTEMGVDIIILLSHIGFSSDVLVLIIIIPDNDCLDVDHMPMQKVLSSIQARLARALYRHTYKSSKLFSIASIINIQKNYLTTTLW